MVVLNANVDKAPGPDGFNAMFFKATWEIIKRDMFKAVSSCLDSGKVLAKWNATSITIIPKKKAPLLVEDYRPIALCDMTYWFTSKVLANRLKGLLSRLIGESQSAFVKGRRIGDNILLAHELCHNLHLDKGLGRMCIKLDIRKAYDSVSWVFLHEVLTRFGFPVKWRRLIMSCVKASLVVTVNGANSAPFVASNGLRQGDPLAPYLFVLCMEVFSEMVKKEVMAGRIKPHSCGEVPVSHLLFADDVLLFAKATKDNARAIRGVLEEFTACSGLSFSASKSQIFMGSGVPHGSWIATHLGMERKDFPVTYLGLPLFSGRMGRIHCMPLINRVKARLSTWQQNFLSMAGRVELVRSVLVSLSIYWTFAFLLPRKVLKEIESPMCHFIWGGPKKWVAVAWKDVCLPKEEGGLGLKRLLEWNDVGLLRLFWLVVAEGNALWVKCIRQKYLKTRSIWLARPPSTSSWAWKGILRVRDIARRHIKYEVGNGEDIRFFQFPWCGAPFQNESWGERLHYELGVPWDTKVSYFIRDGMWNLPPPRCTFMEEVHKRILNTRIHGGMDQPKRVDGVGEALGIKEVWRWVKMPGRKVAWAGMVWHKYAIPKHATTTWRALRGRLPTKSFMNKRGAVLPLGCSLCEGGEEDIEHLFWGCEYIKTVWAEILHLLKLNHTVAYTLEAEAIRISHIGGSRLDMVVRRWVFQAMIHECWLERNRRIFDGEKQQPMHIVAVIKDMVRCLWHKVKRLAKSEEEEQRSQLTWT